MERILILITTYNRPESLLALLHDIKKFSYNYTIELLIFDDCSTEDYQPVVEYLEENFKFEYFLSAKNGGKENYYQLINSAYKEVERYLFDYFIQLADDFRLVDDFFTKAIDQFNGIKDSNKACMNIANDYSRFGMSMWTAVKTKTVKFGNFIYHQTGWVDMAFICTRRFFELIDFSVHIVEPIYLHNKELSSGVGSQLSKRIVSKANIYQVIKSLVVHDNHASVMHPQHRQKNLLISNHETVIATVATMPGREESLKETIKSIIDQVDEIWIYANYEAKFYLQENSKIKLKILANGDIGDAGKFFESEKIKGYHFTIDDDIIYPADYVKTMVHAIEQNQRKYIITVHGRKFKTKPVKSYYHNDAVTVCCMKHAHETILDVPGTGVMAYHTDTIQFSLDDFLASNMADIWVGKKAKENNVPILAITHAAGWIKESRKFKAIDSIYHQCNRNDSLQTEIVNSFISM